MPLSIVIDRVYVKRNPRRCDTNTLESSLIRRGPDLSLNGDDRDRTGNLLHAMQVLSQLSYIP